MSLADQLRAFHRAIVGRAPLASAGELIRADGCPPIERLHVYAHAYVARIAGVLAADYPKLRVLLGTGFDALVPAYLRAHPPHHPSLREAGVDLPRFLAGPHADLARLERARVEAFDGPDAAPLSREAVAALAPAEWAALRLALVPTAMLVELTTNADDVWDAIEDDRPPPEPRDVDVPRVVLVWRRDLAVIHRTVDPDEAGALRRVAAGATFADTCEPLTVERALELLVRWLDAEILAE